jgi:hypothetical protein
MDLRSGLPAAGRDLYGGQAIEEPGRWAEELSDRSGHEETARRKQMKRIHVGSRVRIAEGTILNAALRWPAERRPEPGQMVWAGRDASVTGYQRGAGLPRMRFHDLRHYADIGISATPTRACSSRPASTPRSCRSGSGTPRSR